jgi:hypothetical protein
MKLFLLPTEDTTLYQRYPNNNAGLDEILEIGKNIKPLDADSVYAAAASRVLLNFDVPSDQQYPTTAKYFLNLKIANAENVNRYQQLEVYQVADSWVEGSGYFYQNTKNSQDGATWSVRNTNISWSNAGGDYHLTPSSSHIISKYPVQDIKIDVTNIVAPVVAGTNTNPWQGLLVKFPDTDETSSLNKGNVKVFSGNTHTVFSPALEVSYIDQVFITGSLKPITNSSVTVLPRNLKESYTQGEVDKVYLVVRDRFPDKRFDAVQRYRTQYYLPSESYFRLRDDVSDIVLYDFDEYSAINCDTSGSYFILNTSQLEPNRYYTIDIKIKSGNLTFFPEFKYTFVVDDDD